MVTKLAPTLVLCLSLPLLGASAALRAESLAMAHGWSVHPGGGQAAAGEAIAMMQQKLQAPRLIVLYTTADYGEHEIASTLRARFPEAKLFGMNVYKGVFSSDGLHIGKRGAMAIMGFSGGDHVFGVGVREVPTDADVVAVTKEAFTDAVRDAGMTPDTVPAVVLLGATKGAEDAIVESLDELLPNDVPLVGGTHCDDAFGQGYVIGNNKIHKPGIIVGLIYSKKGIGASFYSGFVGKRKSGTITSGTGRLLKEIDGRPAVDVYRQWADGALDDIEASEQSVMVMSNGTCPLAKAVAMPNGDMRYVPVRPWRFNPDGSLNMGGDIHHGDTIYYVEGNKRALQERAGVVARNALVAGRIRMKDIAGGLHIYCAGAAKTLGLDEGGDTLRMVREIQAAMGGRPFIGGFTAGEQGNIPGYGFFHGNLMSSMVVLSK